MSLAGSIIALPSICPGGQSMEIARLVNDPYIARMALAEMLGEAVGPELVAGFGLVLVSLVLVLGLRPAMPGLRARLANRRHAAEGAAA